MADATLSQCRAGVGLESVSGSAVRDSDLVGRWAAVGRARGLLWAHRPLQAVPRCTAATRVHATRKPALGLHVKDITRLLSAHHQTRWGGRLGCLLGALYTDRCICLGQMFD